MMRGVNMGISYRPLFVLLASKELKKTDLLTMANISRGTLARFAKAESVSTDVINRICVALNCQPGDIMEYTNDTKEEV
jgi:DNA-binding Xre family transcriptional regulator